MSWQDQLNGDSLSWLLEENEPGVRYLALRDLLDLPADHPDLLAAQQQAHTHGPIAAVLNTMHPDGYWNKPGPGYSGKYRSTVWAIILLSQLGASVNIDPRVQTACQYLMTHTLAEGGQFGTQGTPSSNVECLQGNLCAALLALGYRDERLEAAFEWMARSVTGEGLAPKEDKDAATRFYSYNSGPGFMCLANNNFPCAWGAVKEMLAFSRLPRQEWTPIIKRAVQQGVDFLFGTDPATAAYPTHNDAKPSRNWWKFSFPVYYITDLLQNVETLVRLGYADDPRLVNALEFVRQKQDQDGRWPLEYEYNQKTWWEFGEKKQPNKWVTYRAAWVLKNSVTN